MKIILSSTNVLSTLFFAVTLSPRSARAAPLVPGLLDPLFQDVFTHEVPNALDSSYVYPSDEEITVEIKPGYTDVGLVDGNKNPLPTTPIWGYAPEGGEAVWPGMTFEAQKDVIRRVRWENKLPTYSGEPGHLLTGFNGRDVVDETLHWAYSLPGYTDFTLEKEGVPVVVHLHGGHSESASDGNPEFFFSPGFAVKGPRWVKEVYEYANDQPAGTLWYHDHALGITRLNVYAGMAGFYILRDNLDTGKADNPLLLPTGKYEVGLAIQDRMFKESGELFYPAFPGDPGYEDFIDGEGAILPPELFPGGGPTALAEFFGDFIVVNGKAWPKLTVEPRKYRLRLLNGCDSRFLALQFVVADNPDDTNANGPLLPFSVIGSDQSLGQAIVKRTLLSDPGARYDVIFDFAAFRGKRIIMKNIGGDSPFGGDLPGERPTDGSFQLTDRVMAFDVEDYEPTNDPDPLLNLVDNFPDAELDVVPDLKRQLALFEGTDDFGRLQPLLGTIGPSFKAGTTETINWPDTPVYADVGLTGPMEGTIAWHSPTTENPLLDDVEEWQIWNVSPDAHPIHLHLVHFNVVSRKQFVFDEGTRPFSPEFDGTLIDYPVGNGIWLEPQPTVQHDSAKTGRYGSGFKVAFPDGSNIEDFILPGELPQPPEYYEQSDKDMVVALPGQVTTIRAKFDKPGRFVWHCHVLSHEDHEMMRVVQVTDPKAPPDPDDDQKKDKKKKKSSSCFSSANTVEVQDKGQLSMNAIQIGDHVRAGDDKFSRIISFLHLDHDAEANFLQIFSDNMKSPLEITPEHMVFVNEASGPVPASQVKVGDMLGESKVSEIKSVKRRGVYAPLTESGDLVVNGVLASSYAAVHSYTPVNQHWEAHAFFSVRRLVCGINFDVCKSETYTDGFPDWMSSVVRFALNTGESPLLQAGASIVGLPFITAAYVMEQMLFSPMLVSALLFGFLLIKKTMAKASKVKGL